MATKNSIQHPPTEACRIEATERQLAAFRLRKRGMSYIEIGAQLGISDVAAGNLVRKALRHIKKNIEELADEARSLELQRLDDLFSIVFPRACGERAMKNGETVRGAPDLDAMDRVFRIMDRRAKLSGLDAMVKTELTVNLSELTDDQLQRIIDGKPIAS